MSDFASNLASGLLGALIGAFTAIYAVRHQVVLQRESDLRKLLINQRIAIRMMGTIDAQKKQKEDYTSIFQAYEDLRSVYGFWRRRRLDLRWRQYKGDREDYMPLFGTVTSTVTSTSVQSNSRSFDREEIIENIDQFLKCVKY